MLVKPIQVGKLPLIFHLSILILSIFHSPLLKKYFHLKIDRDDRCPLYTICIAKLEKIPIQTSIWWVGQSKNVLKHTYYKCTRVSICHISQYSQDYGK